MVYSSARSNQKFLDLQSVQSIIVGGIKIVSPELLSDPSSFTGSYYNRIPQRFLGDNSSGESMLVLRDVVPWPGPGFCAGIGSGFSLHNNREIQHDWVPSSGSEYVCYHQDLHSSSRTRSLRTAWLASSSTKATWIRLNILVISQNTVWVGHSCDFASGKGCVVIHHVIVFILLTAFFFPISFDHDCSSSNSN